MPHINPQRLGVMFWPWFAPIETIRILKAIGAHRGQLGLHGEADVSPNAALAWRAASISEKFPIETVFAAFDGENYADIPTVAASVGFVPSTTRAARHARMLEIVRFARILGAASVACHIGCLPLDPGDATYIEVRNLVRSLCDAAAAEGLGFSLETGQESAAELRDFIHAVARPNLRVNFDPANMILYGTGSPIEALNTLAPWIATVHAKDGDWPTAPGQLGTERPLGAGAVDIRRWVAKLKQIGYRGAFYVEREVESIVERLADMQHGLALLGGLEN